MSIMECVVSNVAIASVLALVAAIVGRITTKPQVTHTLWLLVLVKLVTPPIFHIPVSYPVSESVALESPVNSAVATNREPTEELVPRSARAPDVLISSLPRQPAGVDDSSFSTVPQESWDKALVSVWIAGSLMWLLLATTRVIRFKTFLRYAYPAPEEMQAEVSTIASRYGLRTIPRVLVAEAKVPPLLWSCGRQTCMVLPSSLLDSLGADERAGLLAHELAHLKRSDHWTRWFEFVVLGVYWWNPVAWWARLQVQQAEEQCCDAWVLWMFPDKARQYAQTLVDTVDFLAGSSDRMPNIATTFYPGHSLKRRIEMIVNNEVPRRLSWTIKTVLILFSAIVAPISLLGSQKETTENRKPDTPKQEEQVASSKDDDSSMLSVLLGIALRPALQQKTAVARIREIGGVVGYDYAYDESKMFSLRRPFPPRVPERIGVDFFHTVVGVEFGGGATNLHLSPLTKLPELIWLDVRDARVTSLTPLTSLTKLEVLHLFNTPVSDLSPLAQLRQLELLELTRSKVHDLSPLAELLKLRMLYLVETEVRDLTPLANLANLESLWLDNTAVRDLTPLAKLSNLRHLDLSDTQVRDLSPLANLTNLQSLHLRHTEVTDISPLVGLSSLRSLGLCMTSVRDLTPLTKLAQLEDLNISLSQVANVSPLTPLTRLKRLNLQKTNVRDEDIAKLQEALPKCEIEH